MGENDLESLVARLEDVEAQWRLSESRVTQYSGLTTLTIRKYKWHKAQIARLEMEIRQRAMEIEDLIKKSEELTHKIFKSKQTIADLEDRLTILTDRYNRYFLQQRPTTVRARIDDIVKRSDELHTRLLAKAKRFDQPITRRTIDIGDDILVLNKNGTYYFAPKRGDFVSTARSLFLRIISSTGEIRSELAHELLKMVHVPAETIAELVN